MKLKCWDQLHTEDLFSDRRFFVVHCDDDEAERGGGPAEEPDTRL